MGHNILVAGKIHWLNPERIHITLELNVSMTKHLFLVPSILYYGKAFLLWLHV